MIKQLSNTNLIKRTVGIASLILASLHLPAQANSEPDLYLIQAFEGVWKMERSASTLLTDRVDTRAEQGILHHEPQVKDAPIDPLVTRALRLGDVHQKGHYSHQPF